MKTIFIQFAIVAFLSTHLFAQSSEKRPLLDEKNKSGTAIRSQQFSLQCVGETNTQSADLKWLPTLTNKCVGRTHTIPDQ